MTKAFFEDMPDGICVEIRGDFVRILDKPNGLEIGRALRGWWEDGRSVLLHISDAIIRADELNMQTYE